MKTANPAVTDSPAIPPLVPSAAERMTAALNANGWTGPKPGVVPIMEEVIAASYRDGFTAGVQAERERVIAELRSEAFRRGIREACKSDGMMILDGVLSAAAGMLDRQTKGETDATQTVA